MPAADIVMKAVVVRQYGGPDVLQMEERPLPQPGPDQACVRVEAAGVNFRDIYLRSGLHEPRLPLYLGLEGAGVVETVGPDVEDLTPGDRVAWIWVQGSYATHIVTSTSKLVPLPRNMTTRDAAAVIFQGVTAQYLATSCYPVKSGDTCLIHAAAGGVGQLLCQIARMRGARVIGTASTPAKAAIAQEAGADDVIFYREQDFEREVKRMTEGRGVQVVYDSVGKDTFGRSLDSLAPRGYLVLFGQSSGVVPPIDPMALADKGSLFVTRPNLKDYTATRDELLERANEVLGWANSGKLRVRVDETYPLAEAVEAHRAVEQRRTSGKVLLLP